MYVYTHTIICIHAQIKLIGSDLAALHEHFSPEALPQELGGTQPPYSGSEWAKTVEEAYERRVSIASITSVRETQASDDVTISFIEHSL